MVPSVAYMILRSVRQNDLCLTGNFNIEDKFLAFVFPAADDHSFSGIPFRFRVSERRMGTGLNGQPAAVFPDAADTAEQPAGHSAVGIMVQGIMDRTVFPDAVPCLPDRRRAFFTSYSQPGHSSCSSSL